MPPPWDAIIHSTTWHHVWCITNLTNKPVPPPWDAIINSTTWHHVWCITNLGHTWFYIVAHLKTCHAKIPRIVPKWGRGQQHWIHSDTVLVHYGMCTGIVTRILRFRHIKSSQEFNQDTAGRESENYMKYCQSTILTSSWLQGGVLFFIHVSMFGLGHDKSWEKSNKSAQSKSCWHLLKLFSKCLLYQGTSQTSVNGFQS